MKSGTPHIWGDKQTLLILIAASALLFTFYLAIAWLFLQPGSLWTPDEGAKLLQIKSLRLDGAGLVFDIEYQGRRLDPELNYALSNPVRDLLRVVDGHLVFERLPLFSLAALPFFTWFGMPGLYLLPALGAALAALLSALLAGDTSSRWSVFALVAFGSPILIYAVIFWEHTLATCLAIAGALVILRLRRRKDSRLSTRLPTLLLAAVLLSAAFYLRQETLIFAAALLVATWIVFPMERRWLILILVLLAISILPFLPLHRALFAGESLPLNARYINLPLGYLRTAQWKAVPDLLIGPAEDEGPDTGWLGGLWALGAVLAVAHAYSGETSRNARMLERSGLVICAAAALYFLFTPVPYRSAHGMLFSSPWAVLGFTQAVKVLHNENQKVRLLALTCIIGLALYSLIMLGVRASSPHGGLEWGARFFLTFYPLLATLAFRGRQPQPAVDRIIAAVLILSGVAFQARGLMTIRADKLIHAALNETIVGLPEEHVVSDLWWLTLAAAPTHPQKALYAAADPAELAAWTVLAEGQDIDSFALVTLDNSLPIRMATLLADHTLAIRQVIPIDNLLIYRLVLE